VSETLRKLAVETEQENLDAIAKQAGMLEDSFEEYKAHLLSAIKEIAHDSDEFSGVEDENGVRL
jgi:myo-inositol catabolism protein IolC